MATKRRRTYRNYHIDPDIPVPRTTKWRHDKKAKTVESSGESHDIPIDLAASESLTVEHSTSTGDDCVLVDDIDNPYSNSTIPSCSTPLNGSSQSVSSLPERSCSPLSDAIPPDASEFSCSESSIDEMSASSCDNECDDESRNSDMFKPFHTGSSVSVCAAICAIMHFCTCSRLSYTAIAQLLNLLQVLCPSPNDLPKTVYQLKKFFRQYHLRYQLHEYCSECKKEVNGCCCGSGSSRTCHIVNVPIEKPLKVIISNHWESLNRAKKSKDDSMRDVWDGTALNPLLSEGRFFSHNNHLALSLSTDGIPLFKSSTISLWPVYLLILNLPPPVRMYGENIVLSALFVGPTKPDMSLLLEPVIKRIDQLSGIGITVTTPNGLSTFRARLVMGVFDLPAKAAVLCSKQYNGEFGCSVCLHPGTRLANGARIFLPSFYMERTHDGVLAAAQQAEESSAAVDGVMGLSPFASTLDLVNSFPVDYMHAVLEGVVRMLLKYWFDSSYHASPFYLGRHQISIDEQLLNQRPPCEFSRAPRSIKKHLKYWKASELRSWLLFYSLPLLLGKLPPLYWHHYCLLVCTLHIMLSDSIEQSQLAAAERMIIDFYKLLPELYGESSCTHNAHLLCHLPKFVRLWGPLWSHSTFDFESKHNQLKHLFHGKHRIIHQLLFNLDIKLTLQRLYPNLLQEESDSTVAYLSKIKFRAPRSNMSCIGLHTYVVGISREIKLTSEHSVALHLLSARVFSRLYKDGILYYARDHYKECMGKRNDTICTYIQDGKVWFGQIELFTLDPVPSALVYPFKSNSLSLIEIAGNPCRTVLEPYKEVDLLSSFMFLCAEPALASALLLIKIDSIVGKGVLIQNGNKTILILQPNNCEFH